MLNPLKFSSKGYIAKNRDLCMFFGDISVWIFG